MVKNRVAYAASALAMVLGVGIIELGTDAWADGCPTADSLAVEGQVASEAELRYAMLGNNDVSEVKVSDNFTISCTTYPDMISKNFALDLNGKTVTAQTSWALDIETSGKTLTIKDTSDNADGAYLFTGGGIWVDNGANLTILSGTIRGVGNDRKAVSFSGGGKMTVNGGAIITTPSVTSDGYGRTVLLYNSSFEMNGGVILANKADEGDNNVGAVFAYNTELLLNNGRITSDVGNAVRMIGDSIMRIEDGVISGGAEGISVANSQLTMNGGEVNATGVAIFTGQEGFFTMNDGTVISRNQFALSGNGSVNTDGEPIYGGTEWNLIKGNVISETSTAIYQPQVGNTTIGDGVQVTGAKSGIEVRAGDLTITGAHIMATGEDGYSVKPNGNGITTTGAAVSVAQHTTRKPINVNVVNGVFSGPVAFSEADPQDGDPIDVKLTISDGKFIGGVVSENYDKADFVEGGEFVNHLVTNNSKIAVDVNGLIVAGSEIEFVADSINDVSGLTLAESDSDDTAILAYDFNLKDKNGGTVTVSENDGVGLTIRMDLTDEQYAAVKEYEKVLIAYFDENGIEQGERIDAGLKQKDDGTWYIEFTTSHLSTYGLLGVNRPIDDEEETEVDPVTATTPETGTMTREGGSMIAASLVTSIAVGVITAIVSFAYLIRRI